MAPSCCRYSSSSCRFRRHGPCRLSIFCATRRLTPIADRSEVRALWGDIAGFTGSEPARSPPRPLATLGAVAKSSSKGFISNPSPPPRNHPAGRLLNPVFNLRTINAICGIAWAVIGIVQLAVKDAKNSGSIFLWFFAICCPLHMASLVAVDVRLRRARAAVRSGALPTPGGRGRRPGYRQQLSDLLRIDAPALAANVLRTCHRFVLINAALRSLPHVAPPSPPSIPRSQTGVDVALTVFL